MRAEECYPLHVCIVLSCLFVYCFCVATAFVLISVRVCLLVCLFA